MSVREGLRVAERADAAGDPAAAVAVIRYLLNNIWSSVRQHTTRETYKTALAAATESPLLLWAIRVIDEAPLTAETYQMDRRGVSCTTVQELQPFHDIEPAHRFATAVGVALTDTLTDAPQPVSGSEGPPPEKNCGE